MRLASILVFDFGFLSPSTLILHPFYPSLSFYTPPSLTLILHSPSLSISLILHSSYPSLSFPTPPFLTLFPQSPIPNSRSPLPYPSLSFFTPLSLIPILHFPIPRPNYPPLFPPLLPNLSSRSPPSLSRSSQTFHSIQRKHVLLTLLRLVHFE